MDRRRARRDRTADHHGGFRHMLGARVRRPAGGGVDSARPERPDPGATSRWFRRYLAVELTLLFGIVPLFLYVERHTVGRMIIPTLLVVGTVCTAILLTDRHFDRNRLWNRRNLRRGLRRMVATFLPGAALLAALVAVLRPDLLLAFPRQRTETWLLVMVMYPVLSVYPQELVYRTFLFHRYRPLFPSAGHRVVVSGVAFGLAHLFFANWIAPVLTTVGGLLFARTYARSASTLQAVVEHALWGNFLFTVGLGWYFYGGAIGS